MLRGEEATDSPTWALSVLVVVCSVPSPAENIKIALSFLFHCTLALPCHQPAPHMEIHTGRSPRPSSFHGHANSSSQGTSRRAGWYEQALGLYEAGTDCFGTAAEISLVKLWRSVPRSYWQFFCLCKHLTQTASRVYY